MNTIKLVRLHASVLIVCSMIGLFGYYFQYGFFQVTACIPATVGMVLMIICSMQFSNPRVKYAILFVLTLAFGIMLTRMSIKFIPQQFQPLRKRIYFPAMAVSSIIAVVVMIRNYYRYRSN